MFLLLNRLYLVIIALFSPLIDFSFVIEVWSFDISSAKTFIDVDEKLVISAAAIKKTLFFSFSSIYLLNCIYIPIEAQKKLLKKSSFYILNELNIACIR